VGIEKKSSRGLATVDDFDGWGSIDEGVVDKGVDDKGTFDRGVLDSEREGLGRAKGKEPVSTATGFEHGIDQASNPSNPPPPPPPPPLTPVAEDEVTHEVRGVAGRGGGRGSDGEEDFLGSSKVRPSKSPSRSGAGDVGGAGLEFDSVDEAGKVEDVELAFPLLLPSPSSPAPVAIRGPRFDPSPLLVSASTTTSFTKALRTLAARWRTESCECVRAASRMTVASDWNITATSPHDCEDPRSKIASKAHSARSSCCQLLGDVSIFPLSNSANKRPSMELIASTNFRRLVASGRSFIPAGVQISSMI